MPNPDRANHLTFATPEELGRWLEANHEDETELWIKIFKKKTGIPSVTWDEVVVESLCWGWIDGIKKSLGEEAYLQRITPRRRGSSWSRRNREHVERLIREDRMTAAGLAPVREARADGRWERAYSLREMEVSADFLAALSKEPKAERFFETLHKASRVVIAHGLESAKRPGTRERRFAKFLDQLHREEDPDRSAGARTTRKG